MHDGEIFARAMTHFENGQFKHCHVLLKILADKYNDVAITLANANDVFAAVLRVRGRLFRNGGRPSVCAQTHDQMHEPSVIMAS
jgi:hypothetical protein